MNTSVLQRIASDGKPVMSTTLALRLLVIGGCAGVFAAIVGVTTPSTLLRDDPELVLLLRGMAAIKTLIVVAAVALLVWRFGHPVRRRFAIGYLIGALLITAATAMIWQLAAIMPAALVFHAGSLLLLVLAWRDDGAPFRPQSRPTR